MPCSIFVPSHLTGFFQIVEHKNPLLKGSRGAGVVIDRGVLTTIKTSSKDHKLEIKIKGLKKHFQEDITKKTVDLIKKWFPFTSGLKIQHQIGVPLGCGFGSSAALALGTSLGLSRVLDLPLTFNQAAGIAHQAEIELGSGLGDLIAETSGGIVMRIKEGSPEFGKLDKIIAPPLYVICKVLGPLDTSSIIHNSRHKQNINHWGKLMLQQLLKKPNAEKFMALSLDFAQKTSLMNSEIKDIVEVLNEETLGSSMAMLGNTAFALSNTPDTSIEDSIIGKIDFNGIKVLK